MLDADRSQSLNLVKLRTLLKTKASGVAQVSKFNVSAQSPCPPRRCDTKPRLCANREGQAPPRLRHKSKCLRDVSLVCVVADDFVIGMGRLAPFLPQRKTIFCCPKQGGTCPSPATTQNHGFVSQAGGVASKAVPIFCRLHKNSQDLT